MVYYIYKMIHVPTGRVYIGQRKLFKRTPETDGYTGSGKIWKRIYKVHPDECVKVVIETCGTRAEADSLERKYIAHYKSVMGEYCVNIDHGGCGGSQPGENHPCFGRHHSEETRSKMSTALKGRVSPTKGKHYSDESRRKISEARKAYWARKRELTGKEGI